MVQAQKWQSIRIEKPLYLALSDCSDSFEMTETQVEQEQALGINLQNFPSLILLTITRPTNKIKLG